MSWLNTNYILRAGVLYVLLLLSGLMSATCQTNAPEQTQHTRYDNRVHRFRRNWERTDYPDSFQNTICRKYGITLFRHRMGLWKA